MKNQFGLAVILSMFFMSCFDLKAQDSIKIMFQNEARQRFAERDFVKALPLFSELLGSFPKEPEYQYGVAVCLLKLHQDPDEAIRLLRSVTVSGYDPMAWYYLGRGFHLNYSFDEAIKAYSRFLLSGRSADIKSLDVERLIEMSKNGIERTRSSRSVSVTESRTIQVEQLQLAAEINGTGKLMNKPVEFCTKSDLKADYRSWMFLPAFTQINEYVYFTGYEKMLRNKKQLFRIRNINHETWGIPEPLDIVINTPNDEEYPYFDTKSSTLYFSSSGHSSMGGLDIFKSVYDWNTKTWSKPENLGFPINSPFDDYLFITDEFNRSASFVSSRSTGPGEVSVYRIRLEQDTTGIRFFNVDDIRKASRLSAEPVSPAFRSVTGDTQDSIPQKLSYAQDEVSQIKSHATAKSDYNKILTDALLLQIKADSLSRITRDKRILAKDTPDDELKKQLVGEIIRTEKEAKLYQREADQKFNEARSLDIYEKDQASEVDSVIELEKEINGIKVFRYTVDSTEESVADTPLMPAGDTIVNPESREASEKEADSFAFLASSPYNESNPFPQGLVIYPGLVYRIQLGVFSKAKPFDAFGGISPVMYEQDNESKVIKYYAGLFRSLKAVTQALDQIRTKGIPDAFIVPFLDGRMISTERAREIEFEKLKL